MDARVYSRQAVQQAAGRGMRLLPASAVAVPPAPASRLSTASVAGAAAAVQGRKRGHNQAQVCASPLPCAGTSPCAGPPPARPCLRGEGSKNEKKVWGCSVWHDIQLLQQRSHEDRQLCWQECWAQRPCVNVLAGVPPASTHPCCPCRALPSCVQHALPQPDALRPSAPVSLPILKATLGMSRRRSPEPCGTSTSSVSRLASTWNRSTCRQGVGHPTEVCACGGGANLRFHCPARVAMSWPPAHLLALAPRAAAGVGAGRRLGGRRGLGTRLGGCLGCLLLPLGGASLRLSSRGRRLGGRF